MGGLAIVIVNWNSGAQLSECLASIVGAVDGRVGPCRVIVVDNASSDGSAHIPAPPGLAVTVVRNAENRGFAAACNQGARAAGPVGFLLFLNPDARLERDSLAVPLAHLREPAHAATGIMGIQLVDADGRVSRTCARFPSASRLTAAALGLDRLAPRRFPPHFMTEWDHLDDAEVDQVIGAFFLVRRDLFDRLAGFDERFFVYFEEVDFALRARQAGYRTYFCAHARAYHKGGGATEQVRARRLFYVLRSRLQFGFKHFSRPGAAAVAATTLFVEPVSRCALALGRRGVREIAETLEGYGLLWSEVPRLLRRSAARTG